MSDFLKRAHDLQAKLEATLGFDSDTEICVTADYEDDREQWSLIVSEHAAKRIAELLRTAKGKT